MALDLIATWGQVLRYTIPHQPNEELRLLGVNEPDPLWSHNEFNNHDSNFKKFQKICSYIMIQILVEFIFLCSNWTTSNPLAISGQLSERT